MILESLLFETVKKIDKTADKMNDLRYKRQEIEAALEECATGAPSAKRDQLKLFVSDVSEDVIDVECHSVEA